MASLAKRIRHVRPGIAQSITTQFRTFKVKTRRNSVNFGISCHYAWRSPAAQTLKKQAFARGVPAAAAVDMSNMG